MLRTVPLLTPCPGQMPGILSSMNSGWWEGRVLMQPAWEYEPANAAASVDWRYRAFPVSGSPDERPPMETPAAKSNVVVWRSAMRAAVFDARSCTPGNWVSIEDFPRPQPQPGEVLLKVVACGVCRTDLHIVEGDLPPMVPLWICRYWKVKRIGTIPR